MSVNTQILLGRLTQDPRVTQLQSSTVANFSVATNEFYKDKQGEKQERTEYHDCVAWGNKFVNESLKKGDQVFLEGSTRTNEYVTKEGETKKRKEVVVFRVVKTSPKRAPNV